MCFVDLENDCIPNPCEGDGSTCQQDQLNSFKCNCEPGLTGPTCEEEGTVSFNKMEVSANICNYKVYPQIIFL